MGRICSLGKEIEEGVVALVIHKVSLTGLSRNLEFSRPIQPLFSTMMGVGIRPSGSDDFNDLVVSDEEGPAPTSQVAASTPSGPQR